MLTTAGENNHGLHTSGSEIHSLHYSMLLTLTADTDFQEYLMFVWVLHSMLNPYWCLTFY